MKLTVKIVTVINEIFSLVYVALETVLLVMLYMLLTFWVFMGLKNFTSNTH